MCGIAGIFVPNGDATGDLEVLERMTRAVQHRGPDDEGYFREGPIALGHRRLSIIDLSTGHQPMRSADGTLAIVFNGEIYNFRELRRELSQRGRAFRTDSDTEVILESFAVWGKGCVSRLRGMFAFAIWDGRSRTLFLARDRVGIKPLYYAWNGGRFAFGSEIKSLLEDRSFRPALDPVALDDYLSYLYVPAPRTIFREIRKLRPGHTLVVSPAGILEEEYWDLRFTPQSRASADEWAAGLRQTLSESVTQHLVSDVPLGAFLSGGIDSSAVVGLMAGVVSGPVTTASIGFDEDCFNELPYARAVAERFQTRRYEKTIHAQAADILGQLTWHYDEPFADSSSIPTYYVCGMAREHVKVCLSGDGGDENFAGYRRYRYDFLENQVRRVLPGWFRTPVFGALGRVYPKADWLPQVFRGKTLLSNLSRSPERAYWHTMTWFTPEMKRVLYQERHRAALEGYDSFSVMQEYFERSRGWDPLARIQYLDIKTYLPDDILAKVDRASMAHSLEVRVPLLDHVVMEYAATIPSSLKLKDGQGKYILKRALADLVPREVLDRSKMGFSIPLAQWLRGELRSHFDSRVLARESFVGSLFHEAAIRRWWGEHLRGQRDHAYVLWALLVLEEWGRRFGP